MNDAEPERSETPPGLPAWVKISGAIVVLVVLVAILVMIVGGGEHGPSRHGAEGGVTTDVTTMATSAGALG
jgi:hypothetical protein